MGVKLGVYRAVCVLFLWTSWVLIYAAKIEVRTSDLKRTGSARGHGKKQRRSWGKEESHLYKFTANSLRPRAVQEHIK